MFSISIYRISQLTINMCMPRLSLYKPEKGKDFKFIDNRIYEMFTMGGTDVFVHKYLGPKNPDEADATADQPRYDAVKETNIQDMFCHLIDCNFVKKWSFMIVV